PRAHSNRSPQCSQPPDPGSRRADDRCRKRLPSGARRADRKGWLMERDRVRARAKAEQADGRRMPLALALTGLVVVGPACVGGSRAQLDIARAAPAVLAGALKPQMQATLKKQVPGLVVTSVKCYVPSASAQITGPCTARFTVSKYGLKGTYKAKAALS